jgi:ABC-type protease/lipase transport system fused ATPase/permease subunit
VEEVSGVDAVRIRVSLFLRLRSAGPALLVFVLAPTVLASLIPAAIAVAIAMLVRRVASVATGGVAAVVVAVLLGYVVLLLAGHVVQTVREPVHFLAESRIRAADAARFAGRLPNGLDTQLGRELDGVELFEGRWQKTALARASMRQAPLLFVLDEPTASLDAPSEREIFTRYLARARKLASRTNAVTVIVSYRFSTVARADLILVLDSGRLLEHGTHSELLAAGGRYAELYSIQAAAYVTA